MRPIAGLAAFLRQLSLFDPPEPAAAPAPPPPESGPGSALRPAPPVPSRPPAAPGPQGNPSATVASGLPERGPSAPVPFADLLRGPYARIEVIPKPRLHESWRVSWIRKREALRLEIPALLAEAARETKLALLEWALLVSRRGRKDPSERRRRADLEQAIREALRAPGESGAARRRSSRDARRLARLMPKGRFHDLDAVFAAVNARYFGGALEARLTWSARLGGLSTHTVARDADGRPYHLLTISRGYDDPEVTPEILGGVVYHECLHIAIPPRREGGRRVVHGPDFRKREREYDHYEAWMKWHREGLPKALRRLRRKRG